MSYLKDRVVIITGAASGFGRIIAVQAAKRGAKVVACDISDEALGETVSSIKAEGGDALGIKADVTSEVDMVNAVESAVQSFGGVDILINNAGIMPLAFFSEHGKALSAWHRCIDINLKGVLNGIAAAYDSMIARGNGHIVNISSIYSNRPVQGAAIYGATKAAVNYLTESLRMESHGKIKVTTVRPTGVPGTGLNDGVITMEAGMCGLGTNIQEVMTRLGALEAGSAPEAWSDSEHVEYFQLSPELLCEQVLYAIDQPWGVSISDVTVRASGDMFIM